MDVNQWCCQKKTMTRVRGRMLIHISKLRSQAALVNGYIWFEKQRYQNNDVISHIEYFMRKDLVVGLVKVNISYLGLWKDLCEKSIIT